MGELGLQKTEERNRVEAWETREKKRGKEVNSS
jgi:hypothetical protein